MRNLMIPAALVLALGAGSAAFAATPAPAAAKPTAAKHNECVSQWKAQKKHTQTEKAFLAACEAK